MFVIQKENVMVLSIPIRLERMRTIFKAHVKIISSANDDYGPEPVRHVTFEFVHSTLFHPFTNHGSIAKRPAE